MGFKLTLTNDEIKAAQSGFTPLAPGTYGAIIYTCEEKVSKAGNNMYAIEFKITDGAEGIGRKVRFWATIAQQALFSVIQLNKAVGFPYPDKDTPKDKDGNVVFEFKDGVEYLGNKVNIVIDQTPYESVDDEGNDVTLMQNNVKRVLAYDKKKVTSGEAVVKAKKGVFLGD